MITSKAQTFIELSITLIPDHFLLNFVFRVFNLSAL